MFLYNRNNGKIEVYSMTPKKEELTRYRMQEMEKIPYGERCIEARASYDKPLENKSSIIYLRDLEASDSGLYGGNFFHSLIFYDDDELMKKYYNSGLPNLDVTLVEDYNLKTKHNEIVKYLLLTNKRYIIDVLSGNYNMTGIISIPRTLYLLQLLEQGKFYKLKDENIYDQLQLFDIPSVPKSIYDMNFLKKISDEGLMSTPSGYDVVISSVETTEEILSKAFKRDNK